MSDLVANWADDEQATARSAERLTGGMHPIFACTGQFVTERNTDFNPFTAFIDIEGPLGADIQNLLELTGIQQDPLEPVL
jgi:hypothetical protein